MSQWVSPKNWIRLTCLTNWWMIRKESGVNHFSEWDSEWNWQNHKCSICNWCRVWIQFGLLYFFPWCDSEHLDLLGRRKLAESIDSSQFSRILNMFWRNNGEFVNTCCSIQEFFVQWIIIVLFALMNQWIWQFNGGEAPGNEFVFWFHSA
jgi:hypothetical protein